MNYKQIMLSLGLLVAAGVAIIGGTIAYYSDTETSQGNVFAAGTIDLKVDHTRQTYNGVDCQTCGLEVYSGTQTMVVGSNDEAANSGAEFPYFASKVENPPHPHWADESSLAPAQWIWEAPSTNPGDTTNNAEYTFENRFQWNGSVEDVILDMALAADNGYKIVLNGITIADKLDVEHNYENVFSLSNTEKSDFENALQFGQNILQITVRNHAGSSNPDSNPAGLLFHLTVTQEECELGVDGFQEACMLWDETDLNEEHRFWTFGDIKPGDWGTNVISLHVYDNDAYLCLATFDEERDEPNGSNIADYIEVFAWIDEDGDGEYHPEEDTSLGISVLGEDGILVAFEPDDELYLSATSTEYISLAWCTGTIEVDQETGEISCDGSSVDNGAQGSTFGASMVAYVEQVRNNLNFNCEDRLKEFNNSNSETPE